MATDLMWTTESNTEPCLLAGVEGREIAVGVMLAPTQGILPRGRVIREDTANGNWISVNAAPAATDRLAILGRTTDTGDEEQLANGYLTGLFNRAAISFGGDIILTDAYEEILRGKGILMDCVIPASDPVPGVSALLAAVADGSSGTASTKIDLTFSTAVELTAEAITLIEGTGSATKGTLTGSEKTWSLAITPTTAGTVLVSISLDGEEMAGSPQTATIYA